MKAQEEDKRLFNKNVKIDALMPVKAKVPPAPVVCLSTFDKIVLQSRNFESSSGQTVAWYRVFASQVTGPNSKARISDYTFPGSGEQVIFYYVFNVNSFILYLIFKDSCQ